MKLFSAPIGPIIDFVEWRPGNDPLYAWRFPETNLSTLTQLIVNESQEAVLFSKGRLAGKFGPGKHTLNTENLPLLRNFFGIPFGSNNPFTAEVWFVNRLMPLNIDWRADAMLYHDPDYQTMVPLLAKGRYGLRVADAERFLVKLVGTAENFTAEKLTDDFRGLLVSRTKSILLQFMQARRIGIKSISAHLDALSEVLKASMVSFWEEFGFSLPGFYITSVEIDSTQPDGERILEAMSRQSAQVIGGYSWQQSQAFEIAGKAVENNAGRNTGLLGALLVSNMLGGSQGASGILQPALPAGTGPPFAPAPAAPTAPREVFCSQCSKRFSGAMKFCPHCGDPYTPCPRCGSDNNVKSARCVSCGTPLVAGKLCACGTLLTPGDAFCSSCGRPGAPTIGSCTKCGFSGDSKAAFCPRCGSKLS
jgi:membrane protease subunit (stomatin/prohibitin family)